MSESSRLPPPETNVDSQMMEFGRMTHDEFNRTVLPNLFHAVDRSSMRAQQLHLMFFRWSLALLVLAALPTLFRSLGTALISSDRVELLEGVSKITALMAALLFASTLIANFIIRLRQHDRSWYQARALAESVKSIAWKYMMGADPYSLRLSEEEAEQRLLSDMRGILLTAPKLSPVTGPDGGASQQITEFMRIIRGTGLNERCQTYLRFRIEDECNWYSGKAVHHAGAEQRLFNWIVLCQITALFLAMTRIAWPKTAIDAGPMLAALAAALLAWSQLKRYSEQSTAYALAAQELTIISQQAKFIKNDEDLAGYVADAESAISREHTMWLARREVTQVQLPSRGLEQSTEKR